MRRKGNWVQYTYEAGEIGEKVKFYVPDGKPGENFAKRERNALRRYEQKLRYSQRSLARRMNVNFTAGDYLISVDFSNDGLEKIKEWGRKKGYPVDSPNHQESRDAVWMCASHELENYLRRVTRELEKDGIELKYVVIVSDMDPDTKEEVRVHYHLVVNKEALGAFLKKWKKMGSVDYEALWSYKKDRTWIAEYFLNQVRQIKDAKKFRYSRNLKRAKRKKLVGLTEAEIRVPKNCKLLSRSEYAPGQIQYIRYELPPRHSSLTDADAIA